MALRSSVKLGCLMRWSAEGGATIARLSEQCNATEPVVRAAVKKLLAKGAVEVKRQYLGYRGNDAWQAKHAVVKHKRGVSYDIDTQAFLLPNGKRVSARVRRSY